MGVLHDDIARLVDTYFEDAEDPDTILDAFDAALEPHRGRTDEMIVGDLDDADLAKELGFAEGFAKGAAALTDAEQEWLDTLRAEHNRRNP